MIVGVVKPYATGAWTHYEVVVAIRPASRSIVTLDPARGWCVNSFEGFLREWEPARRLTVIVAGKDTKGGDR